MNLAKTCPDIPDNWRGNITDTCKILGEDKPLSRNTIRKYIKSGKDGGIRCMISSNGRILFSGKEVKRFWHTL